VPPVQNRDDAALPVRLISYARGVIGSRLVTGTTALHAELESVPPGGSCLRLTARADLTAADLDKARTVLAEALA
jgi:7-keto-8-aminopelargonate synthetase-like enzyme